MLLGVNGFAFAEGVPPAGSPAPGVYVGADAGWISYHNDVQGYSVDLSAFTYSPFVGYQFNRYVAVEGSYIGTGNASTNVSGYDLEYKTHAVQAALVGTLPLSEVGGLYARAGLIRWHDTASSSSLGVSESNDGTNGLYGLGAYLTNGQLGGRLEATTATINGTRVYRVTLGAVWSFR
jgi:hypothetical protein